ncbi:MAG: SAM-dependent chlorinase/fluorinase, partial [Gammaproteobacteria bacterium]|nr:SAM-dependent chlorinase/fluorinase [Gammaproteobacteria bacterium]
LEQIVYVDGYGNLMTGVDARNFNKNRRFRVPGQVVKYAETFCRVPSGGLFWYPNSLGLVEIAANQGSAAEVLSLALGDKILLD